MRRHVEIPEEVYRSIRLPSQEIEQELRKELAVALYQRGAISFGKARQLAGLSWWEFQEVLGKRMVPRHYTAEDLEEDLRYARSGE